MNEVVAVCNPDTKQEVNSMPTPSRRLDASMQRDANVSRTEQELLVQLAQSCRGRELRELCAYEFNRELPDLCQIITAWRIITGAETFDDLLRLYRNTLLPPLRGPLYVLCPEWPNYPYSSILPNERARRLKLLFSDETEAKLFTTRLDPPPGDLWEAINFIRQVYGDAEKTRETVRIQIDYEISYSENLRRVTALLKRLLKTNRLRKARTNVSDRYLRADLKALAALRILRTNGGDYLNAPQLYICQSEWIKAQKRAERIIQSIRNSQTDWPF
jgi:hypothetical protein